MKSIKICPQAFLLGILVILCLTSCTTYLIPVDSFKEQFAGLEPSKEVTTRGPAGDKVKYMTYPITTIKCADKNGSAYNLTVSPSLEMRITYDNNRQTIFYFDLIRVNDTLLTGVESRFAPSIKKTVSIASIKKIEIQDGHKNFRYVNPASH
jgi:hypothetical protein